MTFVTDKRKRVLIIYTGGTIGMKKTENGYAIIKKNSESGLSAYDHIVLDAKTVTEDSVIY